MLYLPGRPAYHAAGLSGLYRQGPTMRILIGALILLAAVLLRVADDPGPTEGDHVLRDLASASGGSPPGPRLHDRTLGSPRRDEQGVVRNADLILHGRPATGRTPPGPGSPLSSSARAS